MSVVRLLAVDGTVSMNDFVPLVNASVGLLVLTVAFLCYWIVTLDDREPNLMSEEEKESWKQDTLDNFKKHYE